MKPTHIIMDKHGRRYVAYSKEDAIYVRDTVGGFIIMSNIPKEPKPSTMERITELLGA